MQRQIAAFVTVIFFAAFFGCLVGIPIIVAIMQRRRDRRRTIAEGKTTEAVITRVIPDRKRKNCKVLFSFSPEMGGLHILCKQNSTLAALSTLGLSEGSQVAVRYLPRCPRYAFVDRLIIAERLAPLKGVDPGSTSSEASSSSVHFISYADPSYKRTGANAFRWTADGDITIGHGIVRFTAQRARPFWFPKRVQQDFPLTAVSNVEAFGNALRCEMSTPYTKSHALQFWAVDASEAQAIAAQLPDSKSSKFAPQLAEAAAFRSRLLEVTPHAPVTPAIVAINALLFVIAAALGGGIFVPNGEVMIHLGSDYTPLTAAGEWWRLLTSTFLHFGILHLGFNMWALWVNGIPTERLYGSTRFLMLYVVAGVAGSLTSFLWHPFVNGAGASGAIFGVLGALFAYFLKTDSGVPRSVLTSQRKSAAIFIVVSIANAARVRGVDNAAHLGGLVAGFVMGLLLARPLEPKRDEEDWSAQWLRALSVVVGGILIVSYYLKSGVLHPRVVYDPSGRPIVLTELVRPPDSFGGVRLGMTASEVARTKGKALREEPGHLLYNSIDDAHDGILDVGLRETSHGATPVVWEVLYWGGHGTEPHGLPDLLDFSREDLIARYGSPISEDHPGDYWGYLFFENGLAVSLEANKVKAYGVYARTPPESH